MPYRDYQAPGVSVIIERQDTAAPNKLVEFLPVFIGNGMTSMSRTIKFNDLTADVRNYPEISFEWAIQNNFNYQLYKETDFIIADLKLHKEVVLGTPLTDLVLGVDYEVVRSANMKSTRSKIETTIKILDTAKITNTDLIFNMNVRLENTKDDFDLRLITADESFYARDIFGPYVLEEDGNTFFNDVAFAAEIAFRTGVQKFFYLEVPRQYGKKATPEEFKEALKLIYYRQDAYRIVPLTDDEDVILALSDLTTNLSNPIDRREIVGFVNMDPTKILDMSDMDELLDSVGMLSEAINNERICQMFGAESVELSIGTKRYTLPMYFLTAAIVALDTMVGMAEPLSTREITIFSKFNGPYFRPRQWNELAKCGVFIVYQPEKDGPITIRHQLTTKQSDAAEYQEYSIIKNFDAVTKRLRDRMKPYAGPMNHGAGYLEKMDATFTGAISEVKELGWAKEITVLQPWSLRTIGNGDNATEERRNLVGKFKLDPVYPANNLDIYLIV